MLKKPEKKLFFTKGNMGNNMFHSFGVLKQIVGSAVLNLRQASNSQAQGLELHPSWGGLGLEFGVSGLLQGVGFRIAKFEARREPNAPQIKTQTL